VEKNDTTGGGSFPENFGSVGNQNSNQEEEEESESVEEISPPPPKTTTSPLHKPLMLFKTISSSIKEEPAQREENKEVFDQVGSNVIWAKDTENSRKLNDSEVSGKIHSVSAKKWPTNQAYSTQKGAQ
jgi:hypothetical protein